MSVRLLSYNHPLLVGVFQSGVSHAAVAECAEEGLFDAIELRLDTFPLADIAAIVSEFSLTFPYVPTIATLRSQDEGGKWTAAESLRLDIYQRILPNVSCIDVEWASGDDARKGVALAHHHGRDAIVSYHQFAPPIDIDFLSHIIEDSIDYGADFVKIACMVDDDADVDALSYLLDHFNHHPIAIIGMGEAGISTRKTFPSLGSRLSFGSIGVASAQGQLTVGEMRPYVLPLKNFL